MRTLSLPLVLVLLLAVPAGPGHAAPAGVIPAPPARSAALSTTQPVPGGPITIEADEIAYDAATNVVTARGRVRVTHALFRLFADTMTFDLRTQVVTAEGRVRLIDAQGRELRGTRVVYAILRGEAIITRAETIVDRVYIRAERVQGTAVRLTVDEATLTTCDPTRPLYRITARRVEIIPGEELVAHDASIWFGSVRVLTVPTYRMSLRDPRGPRLPGLGSNPTDGLWIDYRYPYRLGNVAGELYGKYGQISGFFLLNTLSYDQPAWRLTLDTGRTQREDPDNVVHALTTAELAGTVKPWRVPGLPLFLSGRAAAGWFDELDSAVVTTRLDGTLTLSTETFSFGSNLEASASASYRFSAYGTGEQRTIFSGALALTYRFDQATTVTARYDLASVQGSTPFLFDVVNPTSTVTLTVAHTRPDFRMQAGVSHDFAVPETKLSGGVGFRVSPTVFFDVAAVYNLTTQAFEDLDYTVTFQCDCLTLAVRYRQVRQEISLNVILGVSDRLTFTTPPP